MGLRLGGVVPALAFAGVLSAGACAQPTRSASTAPVPEQDGPRLRFSSPRSQALLGEAYHSALDNLLRINTVRYDPGHYNGSGLLVDPPGTFIRAGGGYEQPWTRDASVNSWNAASLLEPDVARNTLWSVVQREPDGKLIVQQDNQWWDQVVWVVAAWNHYAVTGDRAFLAHAYEAARETLARARTRHFGEALDLFAGPGFFNDGIAAYPAPPATPTEDRGSFVLDYPGTDELMVLSTNCLHVKAYRSGASMARELGEDTTAAAFTAIADTLALKINRYFWNAGKRTYGYLRIDGNTEPPTLNLDDHQEGVGLAFALLFDIADSARARAVLENAHVEPRGIVDVYPSFPRFGDRPGRHNVTVWPMVEGFWALAAAHRGDEGAFAREASNLAQLAASSAGHFYEIYDARTGVPEGGWQAGRHWDSEPDQTWSATAYLAMIYRGLFGMSFTPAGIELRPLLPAGWGDVALSGLRYRGMRLDLRLHGRGCVVSAFRLDGRTAAKPFVPASLTGAHSVDITLRGGCVRR